MRALRTFVVAALMTTTGLPFAHAAERVDLLLVLAADVSNSMEESKFQLQRLGYATAFSNPRVIAAIRAGSRGRIAVAFVEWSGILQQKIVIDWTMINNDETAHQFGQHIIRARSRKTAHRLAPALTSRWPNSIGRPTKHVAAPSMFRGTATTIAVAMSPLHATGPSLRASRSTGSSIVSQTQTSSNSEHNNGHTNPLGGIANYYRNSVIGGPGAFVMVAENFSSFGNALVKKLIAEIAQTLPQQ